MFSLDSSFNFHFHLILAQFPVDYPSYLVPCLVFFVCPFVAFTYYLINRLISFTTWSYYFTADKFFPTRFSWCFFFCFFFLLESVKPQISRTLLSNLDDNAMFCLDSILSLISIFTWLFSKSLGTVPSMPTLMGIKVTYKFHIFFSALTLSKYVFII